MKNISKKTKILVIMVILGLIAGGIFIWKLNSSPNSSAEKNDEPRPNQPNNNSKKYLANEIRTDLTTDFAKLEKGYIQAPKWWTDYNLSGEENIIFCWIKDREKHFIKKTDLEPADWVEIVKEIKRLDQAKEEKYQAKKSEMATNPNLFFYDSKIKIGDFSENNPLRHGFVGKQAGQEYYLLIPTSHPGLKDIDLKEGNWEGKRGTFYLIFGTENMPLQTSPSANTANKIVKTSDQITIKLIKN